MADQNVVALTGRLGADPELRHTADGTPVVNMRLAVNGFKEDDVSWLTIVAFGKLAQVCVDHLVKGRQVAFSGRIQQRGWTAEDGTKRSSVEVIANTMTFLGSKQEQEQQASSTGSGWGDTYPPPVPETKAGGDDDIPF
jgi:single-strand DNA-binding protein